MLYRDTAFRVLTSSHNYKNQLRPTMRNNETYNDKSELMKKQGLRERYIVLISALTDHGITALYVG